MRKCRGKFWDKDKQETVVFESGYFHQWGSNYEEYENGAGNYSIAIVELPEGRVVEVAPSDLVFLDTL